MEILYRTACASGAGGERRTDLNGVEARAKAVYRLDRAPGTMEILYRAACASGAGGREGGEENGPERSGSARQSSVPARPSARDHRGVEHASTWYTRSFYCIYAVLQV
jgi:hypothetical protein